VETDPGQPVAARVVLVAEDPRLRIRPERFRVEHAGLDGRVTMTGIPPGRYRVFALASEPPMDVHDPALLKALGRYAAMVEVEAKGRVKVTVQPVPYSAWEALR
ncbi:MAG: hypothetical protein NTY38_14680, partial [Acidobacteria bacterium]|nr:hypothetical protein [Acidobacteriota bacterium]